MGVLSPAHVLEQLECVGVSKLPSGHNSSLQVVLQLKLLKMAPVMYS